MAALHALTKAHFAERDSLETIGRETLMERLHRDDSMLIDVRPEREFAARHLPGALSIPIASLEKRLAELPKNRTIIAEAPFARSRLTRRTYCAATDLTHCEVTPR